MTTLRKIDTARGDRIRHVRTEILGLRSQAALAELLSREGKSVTRGAVGNWEQGKEVSFESLKLLSKVAGVRLEWLASNEGQIGEPGNSVVADVTNETQPKKPRPNASFPPRYEAFSRDYSLPVLGQVAGGPNGRFILNGSEVGRVFTPPMLEGVEGAYAVRVYGTSMEPRYMAGETVWINPHEPVRQGDDVVVQLLTDEEHGRESYIKQFISRSSKVIRLWQHNPEEDETKELAFDTNLVFSIHKIVFHATV